MEQGTRKHPIQILPLRPHPHWMSTALLKKKCSIIRCKNSRFSPHWAYIVLCSPPPQNTLSVPQSPPNSMPVWWRLSRAERPAAQGVGEFFLKLKGETLGKQKHLPFKQELARIQPVRTAQLCKTLVKFTENVMKNLIIQSLALVFSSS